MLEVADANGFSGGIENNLFTVTGEHHICCIYAYNLKYYPLDPVDGNPNCLPSTPSTDLMVTANVSTSEQLQTCQLLGLQVTGGTQPYTVSIAALNSNFTTNVTMDSGHDLLTYINRVTPGSQFAGEFGSQGS